MIRKPPLSRISNRLHRGKPARNRTRVKRIRTRRPIRVAAEIRKTPRSRMSNRHHRRRPANRKNRPSRSRMHRPMQAAAGTGKTVHSQMTARPRKSRRAQRTMPNKIRASPKTSLPTPTGNSTKAGMTSRLNGNRGHPSRDLNPDSRAPTTRSRNSRRRQTSRQQTPEPSAEAEALNTEEQMAAQQWLRRIPDDPGGLLRRKFLYQYRQRAGSPDGGSHQDW